MAKIYSEKNKKCIEMVGPKKSTIKFLLDYSKGIQFEKSETNNYLFFKN